MGDIALEETDRAPGQIGGTFDRRVCGHHQCGRLVEYRWPRDHETGKLLVDDLGAAKEEDVVAPLPDGVEGRIGIIDADRSLHGSAGGGDADRATEIDEQAGIGSTGRWREQAG